MQTKTLTKALGILSGSCNPKHVLPVLCCVRVIAGAGKLLLITTNLETSTEVELPYDGEKINKCFNFKWLKAILKGTKMVVFTSTGVVIDGISINSDFNVMEVDDFPLIHGITTTGQIPANVLNEVVREVSYCRSTDDMRPAVTGTLMRVSGKDVKFCGADSHRLHVNHYTGIEGIPEGDYILPSSLSNYTYDGMVDVGFAKGGGDDSIVQVLLAWHTGELFVCTTSRLVSAKFPAYEAVIPTSTKPLFVADERFLPLLDIAAQNANDNVAKKITIEVTPKGVILTHHRTDIDVPMFDKYIETQTGWEGTIAFNAAYLAAIVRLKGTCTVHGVNVVEADIPSSPVLLMNDDESKTALLMPLLIMN